MRSPGAKSRYSILPRLAARIGLVVASLSVQGILPAEACPLTGPVVLKDMQHGFAGPTGTVWTIAPDCSFTVARQVGSDITETYRLGSLTPEQQARLDELLAWNAAADLPEQLGGDPQVNARRITFSYGGKVSVLSMPPGGGDLAALRAAAGDYSTRRLLGLAAALAGMTSG